MKTWKFWGVLLWWLFKRMLSFALLVSIAAAFCVDASSWLRDYCDYALLIQPHFSWGFLAVLLLTPFIGRFFCESLCPLGIMQSIVARISSPRKAVRRVCTKLPVTRVQFVVRWSIVLVFALLIVCGFGAIAHLINPYSIVSKSLMYFASGNAVGNDISSVGNVLNAANGGNWAVNVSVLTGLVIFSFVVISAFFGKGRLWCNWVCPFGSVFSILSMKCFLPNKVCKGCENCRRCFPSENKAKNLVREESCKTPQVNVSRREAIKGVALVATAHTLEKTTDGGLAPVSMPGVPSRPSAVLPPGAVPRNEFNLKCVGCGLCVTRCPMNVLRQSVDLKSFGQVEMYFQNGYCRLSCDYKCAKACPTGALLPRIKDRANLHMGHAIWKKNLCLRNVAGDGNESCKACVRKCPVGALHLVDGAVVIDKTACVGCGACEHVCPVRPMPAIIVKGFDRQREVLPMAESDLVAEMISRLDAGDSCVIAKSGVIVSRDKGSGIKPLLMFLDDGKLDGAIVADKIIGRAAAAICIVGKAQKVYAKVMTEEAKLLLEKFGIKASGAEMTKEIINREKTGLCPMESAVRQLSEPAEMVKAVRQALGKLSAK